MVNLLHCWYFSASTRCDIIKKYMESETVANMWSQVAILSGWTGLLMPQCEVWVRSVPPWHALHIHTDIHQWKYTLAPLLLPSFGTPLPQIILPSARSNTCSGYCVITISLDHGGGTAHMTWPQRQDETEEEKEQHNYEHHSISLFSVHGLLQVQYVLFLFVLCHVNSSTYLCATRGCNNAFTNASTLPLTHKVMQ